MAARWRTVCVVVLSCAGLSACSATAHLFGRREQVYVSNYKDDTVSVVDGGTNREIKVIEVGASPFGIAARSQPPLVAVANSTGGRVTLIDPVKMEVVRTVDVGDAVPEHVAFSVDGTRLFVTLPKAGKIALIDPDAGQLRETINIGRKPKRLAVSPDGRRLYVLLHVREGGVDVIDIATRAIQTTIPTGAFPTDFALTRDGRRLLVASFDDDNVTVIDTEALTSLATWPVGTGFGLVVHPTKPIAYSMESFDGTVQVLNYETGQVTATLQPGDFPTYSAITPDGKFLYVVNEDSSSVSKYDTETNERTERIAVGGQPANAVVVIGR